MLIGDKWNAMLNWGLVQLGDRWAESRVFYCCGDKKTCADVGLACRAIHETEQLPWPDENCVVASEGWPVADTLAIVARHGSTNRATILTIVYGRGPQLRHRIIDTYAYATYDPPVPSDLFRQSVERDLLTACRDEGIDPLSVVRNPEAYSVEAHGAVGDIATLAEHLFPPPPIAHLWVSAPRAFLSGFFLVYALANLATACGYRVRGVRKNGYGKPSLKKRTQGGDVLFNVPFERIHTESVAKNLCTVAPHSRRGYWRHEWKRAGLDRLTLPRELWRRMQLAFARSVRRVYVSPCWVGPRTWFDRSYDYAIED